MKPASPSSSYIDMGAHASGSTEPPRTESPRAYTALGSQGGFRQQHPGRKMSNSTKQKSRFMSINGGMRMSIERLGDVASFVEGPAPDLEKGLNPPVNYSNDGSVTSERLISSTGTLDVAAVKRVAVKKAVGKAVRAKGSSTPFLRELWLSASNILRAVRQRPSVLIWPFLFSALLLIVGIVVANDAEQKELDALKKQALLDCQETGTYFLRQFDVASVPLKIVDFQLSGPARMWNSSMMRQYEVFLFSIMSISSPLIKQMEMQPSGVIEVRWPLTPNATRVDTLALDNPRREEALQAIHLKTMLIEGPYALEQSAASIGIVARLPIFIRASIINATYGYPVPPTACSICFQPYDDGSGLGDTFWGFTTAILSTEFISNSSNTASGSLQAIERLGYDFLLTRLGPSDSAFPLINAETGEVLVAVSDRFKSDPARFVNNRDPEVLDIDVPGNHWRLYVAPKDGWRVEWSVPVYVMICVAWLLIFVLLTVTTVNSYLYKSLLTGLMPAPAIRSLQRGEYYSAYYEHISVLVINLSIVTNEQTASFSSAMVELLNEVYTAFDKIVAKYPRLQKVGNAGDTYTVTGGCPYRSRPHNTTQECSSAALEILEYAQNYRSATGFRVSIRAGLHIGPGWAAVVGKTTPTWGVFGDAVSLARKLQEASAPQRIHVSASSAVILAKYFVNDFFLESRGLVEIRGKGVIPTYWLSRAENLNFMGGSVVTTENGTAQKGSRSSSQRSAKVGLAQ